MTTPFMSEFSSLGRVAVVLFSRLLKKAALRGRRWMGLDIPEPPGGEIELAPTNYGTIIHASFL